MRVSSIGSPPRLHLARLGVELEVLEAQDLAGPVGGAPEQRTQACEQLLEGERLREVVVRAGVQAFDTVFDLHPGREHQHGQADACPAEAPANLEPVDLAA